MQLFHVSTDMNHPGLFNPEMIFIDPTPEDVANANRGDTMYADRETVTMCASIEECFTSVPWGGENAFRYMSRNGNTFRVFVFDIDVSDYRLSVDINNKYHEMYTQLEYTYYGYIQSERFFDISVQSFYPDYNDQVICDIEYDINRIFRLINTSKGG